MQSLCRANRAHIPFREQLTLVHIFDHKQRPPKPAAAGLAGRGSKLHRAQSFFGHANRIDHRLEFLRLE